MRFLQIEVMWQKFHDFTTEYREYLSGRRLFFLLIIRKLSSLLKSDLKFVLFASLFYLFI
jgi:hypothetical protein